MVPTDRRFGQAVGPTRPVFMPNGEFFWVQSLNFGLECRF
jgi:hypothetical protein